MIKIPRSIMPNFFTIGNMFCGYMSVIFAVFQNNLVWASWMIFLAAFFDTMDGKVARLTNASSKFGVEYDSLADNISFGLAPSILIYTFFFQTWGSVGIFLSFFPLLFVSIRLARFNVQLEGFDKSEFVGLPSPSGALTLAGYVIFVLEYFPGETFPRVLVFLTLFVSVLMVSTISYDVLRGFSTKGSFWRKLFLIFPIAVVVALFFYPSALAFPIVFIYVLSGFIRFLYRLGKGKRIRR